MAESDAYPVVPKDVNSTPDEQMHHSVTGRCTMCGLPRYGPGPFELCSGERLGDSDDGKDFRHQPAEVRLRRAASVRTWPLPEELPFSGKQIDFGEFHG